MILVSAATLDSIDDHFKDVFTVSPGGEHANGHTYNKLLLFQDGVYIELIAFKDHVSLEDRKKHPWGQLENNTIVDWAVTLPEEGLLKQVQARVRESGSRINYQDTWDNGRRRPDGVELKWSMSFALDEDGKQVFPGTLPFWCLDQTDRALRVPYEDGKTTTHPSGALGVSRVHVKLSVSELAAVKPVYAAVFTDGPDTGADSQWQYIVPSGATNGKQLVAISEGEGKRSVHITFAGSEPSASTVEILPGLTVAFEKA